MTLAEACATAGQVEEALDHLERAYLRRDYFIVWDLATDPQWDNLRGHPRFKQLLDKLDFARVNPKVKE